MSRAIRMLLMLALVGLGGACRRNEAPSGPASKSDAPAMDKNSAIVDEAPKKTANAPSIANADNWTWQELQDYLASKGLQTSRGKGQKGMWFKPGDGTPLEDYLCDAFETMDTSKLDDYRDGKGMFLAKKFSSVTLATKEAARRKDEDQVTVLAWRCFIFEASPATRIALKKLLQ